MSCPPRLWDGVLCRLGVEMPAFTVDAWLRPLGVEETPDGLRLLCPSPFHRERVRERFLPQIRRCVEAETGHSLVVDLGVDPAAAEATPAAPPPDAGGGAPAPAAPPPRQLPLSHTFETFVVGPCNALAREASFALAQARQRGLNPLYLAAEPGLGKTHLARAVVHEARLHGVQNAIYESAETFTNRFMAAIRSRSMERFKRRYREGCDLLVLEDVQFVGSKAATQLELFHTVTHLIDAGVRIVLTGDRLPRDIDGLQARMRSQLTAGLVAEIERPDAEVRRSILRSKAAAGGVRLPADCLELLVESVRGSVRDLEGALGQLVATAALLKRPIDVELARTALHKIAPQPQPRRLDVETVLAQVEAFFGARRDALASRSRRRDVLLPRQLGMYLCRRYTDAPLAEIARAFGRDHPAVSNAVRAVERAILERAPLRYQVEELSARLERLR